MSAKAIRVAILLALSVAILAGFVACGGREASRWTLEGYLLAGDTDVWLVDTTPLAIGGATIGGERPEPGAAIRATGRHEANGVWQAEQITVGAVNPAALASRLPVATVSGPVTLGAATGQWRVADQAVRVPVETPGARGVTAGEQVTVQGYRLPSGEIVAAAITRPPQPAAPPTRPGQRSAPPTATTPDNPTPAPPTVAPMRPVVPPTTPRDKKDDDDQDHDKGKGH